MKYRAVSNVHHLRMNLLGTILHDLKYAVRVLSRARVPTIVTIFSLALGIGVNTSVFTAHKAFVRRSIDARNPSEMVNIALARDSGSADYTFSNPEYEAYRELFGC